MRLGTAVFALLIFQPMLRSLHFLHVWIGRIVIGLGILAGGLGIRLAEDLRVDGAMDIYVVLTGSVALLWMVVVGWWYVERTRGGVISVW